VSKRENKIHYGTNSQIFDQKIQNSKNRLSVKFPPDQLKTPIKISSQSNESPTKK
jgi:hypothetical protein